MALFGVFAAEGRAEADFHGALSVMAIASPPRMSFWRRPGLALGGCDGAELTEQSMGSADMAVLFDGHLDNRIEIRRRLNLTAEQSTGDADLILRAWQNWGEDFLSPVVGRFSCAVWDGIQQQLVLGVDALGKRPLHFWHGPERFVFASEPRGILVQPEVGRDLNPTHIAEILALVPPSSTGTLYAQIHRLPPGHLLVANRHGHRLHRYWQPENIPELILPTPQAYADCLRDSLEQAVACRLPAAGNVGCFLSSGLDSPSVASVAARQLARQGRQLVAFTAVPADGFDGPAPPGYHADEGPLAAQVAARHPNMDHVLIPNDSLPLFDAIDMQARSADWPALNPSNLQWSLGISQQAKERNIAVMLTGEYGNLSLSYDGMMAPAQMLRQGRIDDLLSLSMGMRTHGVGWPGVINAALCPLIPGLRQALQKWRGNPEPDLFDYSLINPTLAQETNVLERARRQTHNLRYSVQGDGRAMRLLLLRRTTPRAPIKAGYRRLFQTDYADPLMDRRLFELCLSFPEERFIEGGEPRSLVRRAMRDVLPPTILTGLQRGLQAADWHRVMGAARPLMLQEISRLEDSPMASRCLDLPRMRHLIMNWPGDNWHTPAVSRLFNVALSRSLSMGRFLRRVEQTPTSSIESQAPC